MTPQLLAGLAIAFVLGAMSPGPSLATVLRNSVSGGRQHGILTGIGHGLGFGIYAFLAATGMAAAISTSDTTVEVLRWGGIAMLLFLTYTFGKQALSSSVAHLDAHKSSNRAGFAQGFLIAIFNPKIFAWMLAIYAPFIKADLGILTLLGIAVMGMIIDATWYVTVATFLTSSNRADKLRAVSNKLDAAMAALMLTFASLLLLDLL